MSTSYSIRQDLKEAEAMVDSLEDYVRGDQLYGNTGGSFFSKMPSLTVGALLMRLQRLESLQSSMSDEQQATFQQIHSDWEQTRQEWRSHYEDKVLHEIESRIESMKSFFRECADSQQNCHQNYRPEIQKRTIIHELLQEVETLNIDDDSIIDQVTAADSKLRSYMRPDDFQWDDTLQAVYSRDDYWWLYQKPPQPQEA